LQLRVRMKDLHEEPCRFEGVPMTYSTHDSHVELGKGSTWTKVGPKCDGWNDGQILGSPQQAKRERLCLQFLRCGSWCPKSCLCCCHVLFFSLKTSPMLGFSFSCLTAWGVSAREKKGKEGKGRKRKGKDGKGRERKGKDRKGTEKDGKGRERNGADGCGRPGCKGVAGNGWGEEAAGDERAWLRGRLRTGNGCGEVRGRLWMARVQRRGWKWMGRRSRW